MPIIIGEGSERDPNNLPLFTRNRNRIPNSQRLQKIPKIMAAAEKNAHHKRTFPEQFRTRSLLSTYNCVGMALASRRTYVDIAEALWILKDDGYVIVPPPHVLPGDILLYKDSNGEPTHIAVVFSHVKNVETADFDTLVVSQWGADGEYMHVASDVNFRLGTPDVFLRMEA